MTTWQIIGLVGVILALLVIAVGWSCCVISGWCAQAEEDAGIARRS